MAGKLEYKAHTIGSNAAYIHKAFDERGPKAAFREAEKRDISRRTVQNWISMWRDPKTKQVRTAAAAKKAVKKVSAKAPAKTKKKLPNTHPAVRGMSAADKKKTATPAASKSTAGKVVKGVVLNG